MRSPTALLSFALLACGLAPSHVVCHLCRQRILRRSKHGHCSGFFAEFFFN